MKSLVAADTNMPGEKTVLADVRGTLRRLSFRCTDIQVKTEVWSRTLGKLRIDVLINRSAATGTVACFFIGKPVPFFLSRLHKLTDSLSYVHKIVTVFDKTSPMLEGLLPISAAVSLSTDEEQLLKEALQTADFSVYTATGDDTKEPDQSVYDDQGRQLRKVR